MSNTVEVAYDGDGFYRIDRSFSDIQTEIVLFSLIVDQTISDISTEHRKKNTFANILGCVFKVEGVWEEFKNTLGSFEKLDTLPREDFSAEYELIINKGIFFSENRLSVNYQPKYPKNKDGKISVSTTIYSIDLVRDIKHENKDYIEEVLQYQSGYYEENGFPDRPSDAPSVAIKNTLKG